MLESTIFQNSAPICKNYWLADKNNSKLFRRKPIIIQLKLPKNVDTQKILKRKKILSKFAETKKAKFIKSKKSNKNAFIRLISNDGNSFVWLNCIWISMTLTFTRFYFSLWKQKRSNNKCDENGYLFTMSLWGSSILCGNYY